MLNPGFGGVLVANVPGFPCSLALFHARNALMLNPGLGGVLGANVPGFPFFFALDIFENHVSQTFRTFQFLSNISICSLSHEFYFLYAVVGASEQGQPPGNPGSI